MSTLRRAAATATDLACLAAGRRPVVRAARFVLGRARLDVPNDLHTNGESSLQRWVLDMSPPGRDTPRHRCRCQRRPLVRCDAYCRAGGWPIR